MCHPNSGMKYLVLFEAENSEEFSTLLLWE